MDQRAQSREVIKAIREVLLNDWDPIGVKDEPAARDEYDDYVGGVYQLLVSGASANQIAEYLGDIETDELGLGAAAVANLLPVAEKLLKLNRGPLGDTVT